RAGIRQGAGRVRRDDHLRVRDPGRDANDLLGDLRPAAGARWRTRHLAAGTGGDGCFAAGAAGLRVAGAAPARRARALMLALDIVIERGTRSADGFRRHVRVADDARVIALAGHSGAGKTSVLHAIAGLIRPREGRIEIDGRCLFDTAEGIDVPVHRRHVGYVFQDARLFPHLTVRGNLRYGRRGDGAATFAFDDVVALLGIGALLKRRTANLSGGEAQRVA